MFILHTWRDWAGLITAFVLLFVLVFLFVGLIRSGNKDSDDAWAARNQPRQSSDELAGMLDAALAFEDRQADLKRRVELEQFLGGEVR